MNLPGLLALWLPILLSAVVVFVISSLIHMVFKWHASDYKGFANEDAVRGALRVGNPEPGKRYVVPYCADMKEMGSEAMRKKYAEGPNAVVVFGPTGQPGMGRQLGVWFLWSLIIALGAGFIVAELVGISPWRARAGAKLVGAFTFAAYGLGTVTESIWMYRSWISSAKYLLDSALYAVGSALVFYHLWP